MATSHLKRRGKYKLMTHLEEDRDLWLVCPAPMGGHPVMEGMSYSGGDVLQWKLLD